MWGKARMLYYVNPEEISYEPSSFWHYRSTNQANQAALMAVGSHIGTTAVSVCVCACVCVCVCVCVCTVCVCALTDAGRLRMFVYAEIDLNEHSSLIL